MVSHASIESRIRAVREVMAQEKVDALAVLTADPHMSEYLPSHWQARAWLSGFAGSAGTLVLTSDFAGLWTDSRYWEQAENDLRGSGIVTMRAGSTDVPGVSEWLADNLREGATIAVDGLTLNVQTRRQWEKALQPRRMRLRTELDLVGRVWTDRPPLPRAPIYQHLPPFACRSRVENIGAVRQAMAKRGADWHWMSSLDDIAWTLNLRGSDVSYNPVFLAHALLSMDAVQLFVAADQVDEQLVQELAADGITIRDYADAHSALSELADGEVLLIDPARTTVNILQSTQARIIEDINPAQLLKSRKTEAELEQVRATMEQDGAALCEFFAWLEGALGKERISELTIDEKITAARATRPHFVSPSFSTIAAFNANAAMPHYHATPESHALIEGDGLLLIDSGGQYLGGTTDITRMVAIGQPSEEQKRDVTAVLQGMIALSRAVFPRGMPAPMLDPLARAPLWRRCVDFGHGTGHGVGYFMNVHEGPQSISYRTPISPNAAMEPGMITSNEPGLYRPGKWGIRIENLVANTVAGRSEFGEFLRFETLTLCPIDVRCIDVQSLQDDERQWLNDYHAEVRQRLSPHVQGAAREWLLRHTEPL